MRLDKWLQATGIVPRRERAKQACDAGLIEVDGKQIQRQTQAVTVADALLEAGVQLGPLDRVKPDLLVKAVKHGQKVVIPGARHTPYVSHPEEFQVVGAKEADPRSGKISNESPFGRALLEMGTAKEDYVKLSQRIGKSTGDFSMEVIVIDNQSSDNSVDMLRNEFAHVVIISNTENVGFARACNQGIQISSGRYLLLLNSDTELFPDTLAKALHFMDRERPDPRWQRIVEHTLDRMADGGLRDQLGNRFLFGVAGSKRVIGSGGCNRIGGSSRMKSERSPGRTRAAGLEFPRESRSWAPTEPWSGTRVRAS